MADRQLSPYGEQLTDNAREWLKNRGLNDETIERAQLGQVMEPLPEHAELRGWISLPFYDGAGRIRMHRFRRTDDGKPKYMSEGRKGTHIFDVERTAQAEVWITEGEFDALILQQMGFDAVGLPGSTSWRNEWRFLFANCERVTVVCDGDDAGRQMGHKVASALSEVCECYAVELPANQDPTSLYLSNPDQLKEAIA